MTGEIYNDDRDDDCEWVPLSQFRPFGRGVPQSAMVKPTFYFDEVQRRWLPRAHEPRWWERLAEAPRPKGTDVG